METENQKTSPKPVTAAIRAAEAAKAITDGDIVLATIDVPASPERVARALMTDECERWWGAPGVYTMESWKATLLPGGTWSLVIRLPDGTALPSSGDFLEVTPAKIVQTRRYDFDHPTLGRRVTKVTTHLSPVEHGTRIVVRHEGFGATEPAVEHAGGWERMLDWLGEHLRAEGVGRAGGEGRLAMSQFIFLYREATTPTPKELEVSMAKCLKWFEDLEAAGHLSAYGHPLNRTDERFLGGSRSAGPLASAEVERNASRAGERERRDERRLPRSGPSSYSSAAADARSAGLTLTPAA